MKYCAALNGSLNIERDRVHFCYAVKQNLPTVPWNIDEELPVEQIQIVRDVLLKGLNGNLDEPIAEYSAYGEPSKIVGHPCKGCRHITEMPDDFEAPPTTQLTCYLHLQAFTYCNLKCSYCNLRNDEGRTPLHRGKDLDHSVYKALRKLVDENVVDKNCRIIFSSGEPALSKEGMAALAHINNKGFNILINTNASNFAPEIAEALASGRTTVQVSIDSGDSETYLDVKGTDHFNNVAANIDRYITALKGGSQFWLKYIVFSKTRAREKLDKFLEFCVNHKIRNVVVNANYNEGEDVCSSCGGEVIEHGNDAVDIETLKSFGYLSSKLELNGINTHKEFSHLTTNEKHLSKIEYAHSVMDLLGIHTNDPAECTRKIIEGMEMAMQPSGDLVVKECLSKILKVATQDSKRIALFSAGSNAQWINSILNELGIQPVVAFDNNHQTPSRLSFPEAKPSEMSSYDIDTIIIASNAYHLNINSQLLNKPDITNVKIINPYLYLGI